MEEISDKQLQLTKWYLDNKNKFYRILVKTLILVNLVLWGIAIYYFTTYLLGSEKHRQMLFGLTSKQIDYLKFHEHFKPYDLAVDKSVFLALDVLEQKKRYDFLAIVENPNEDIMVASVEYYFSWETGQTETEKNFILPGEKKYLTLLGQDADRRLNKAQFVITNIEWRRIRPHEQMNDLLSKLSVGGAEVDYVIGQDRNVSVPELSFKIKNQSIYGFWETRFIIILYRGSDVVGLNVLTVKQWESNEEKKLGLVWPDIPPYTRIAVILEINPFDRENFMSVY